MAESETAAEKQTQSWTQKQVYIMSTICVVVGLAFGYLLRGSESASAHTPVPVVAAAQPDATATAQHGGDQQAPMPSLDDMKRMADKKAEPLLAQLKNDPKNPKLLLEIGNTYKSAHQFDQAAKYYGQALEQNPKEIALRDEVGAAQYYSGDVDGAIATFEGSLKYSPNDASTLFDLGVLKLEKKNDAKGAVELWQHLLKTNPDLSADKKQQIQKMIADAKTKPLPALN